MSIVVGTVSNITTQETIATGPGDTATLPHAGMNTSYSLNASSTPKAQAISPFTSTLSSGTQTIDMTALPTSTGGTQDATTLGSGTTAVAIQTIKITAPTGNGAAITIAPGVSNGYKKSGGGFIFSTSGLITMVPGDEVQWVNRTGTSAPNSSGSCKILTLTGTGSSDSLNFTMILG